MSESARRGREVFFGNKAACNICHRTPAPTDNDFHNTGLGWGEETFDPGRYLVTGEQQDPGAFKTPPVRNAELTAPYMHDGSLATLEEVVAWYSQGGRANPYLDKYFRNVQPLTEQEQSDLVAFMKACTGELPQVETGRLPE